jgi:hypothetical protein
LSAALLAPLIFRIEKRGCVIGLLISVRDHTPLCAGKYPPLENKYATGTAPDWTANRFVTTIVLVVNVCRGTLHGYFWNYYDVMIAQ